jgi:hypothetical protein
MGECWTTLNSRHLVVEGSRFPSPKILQSGLARFELSADCLERKVALNLGATMTPEARYVQLGELISTAPSLNGNPLTPEEHRWLGRLASLVEGTGGIGDQAMFRVASDNLVGFSWQQNWRACQMFCV